MFWLWLVCIMMFTRLTEETEIIFGTGNLCISNLLKDVHSFFEERWEVGWVAGSFSATAVFSTGSKVSVDSPLNGSKNSVLPWSFHRKLLKLLHCTNIKMKLLPIGDISSQIAIKKKKIYPSFDLSNISMHGIYPKD